MDLNEYIHESVFEENDKYTILYELLWENLEEDGFVITDEEGCETDAIIKAVALKNIIDEFVYRLYDAFLDAIGISEDDVLDYCKENPDIDVVDGSNEKTLSNAFSSITEKLADKLLELFSADDLFDYLFTATYDFEQDFTFAFEDVDEFQAFVDSNTERLDDYKEEYPAVMSWIEGGMIV